MEEAAKALKVGLQMFDDFAAEQKRNPIDLSVYFTKAELTKMGDYEQTRMKNIVENNLMMKKLGITLSLTLEPHHSQHKFIN